MSQLERKRTQRRERVHVGAYVDADIRDGLLELARTRDRSVSSILRRALRAELDRAAEGKD
jgi:predicted transcriptional regulator